jgi:subtilisin family serine protease
MLIVLSSASAAAAFSGAGTSTPAMSSVIVTLREQADVRATAHGKRPARLRATIEALQATADRTQGGLIALLKARQHQGRVADFLPMWVFNGLAVTATPGVIDELARRPEVQSISPDGAMHAPAPSVASSTPEANITLVNAPALWDLGLRGQGVVVASMDTGVDVNHVDLSPRWRGGTNSWYDPNGQHPTTPTDVSGHGTATMGVMVGGDAGGTAIGIAPEAKWIAVKIFNDSGSATTSRIHQGFQWLLDPDHDPSTPDAPNVVNNSWDFAQPGCNLEFQLDLRSLRAAGILPVFAAGNSGPNSSTSFSPANNPEAFAVGATDGSDAIYSGSSRGPSACGEAQTTFPELVAPGVNIRSSDLFGGYATGTGTSLSAPHVAGALALLLGAFPDALADQQASALQSGAVDLGASGPDNSYGYGRLDALAAYNWLGTHPDFSISASPTTANTLPGGSVTYTVSVTPANGFSGDVALSLAGLSPSQGSWTFTPATVVGGSGSSQLSVTAASSLSPGTYPLTITGTSGNLVRSSSVTLVVNPPPDFSISASPATASTLPGGSVTYTVSVTPANGFSGDVTLSLAGLPSSQGSSTFTPPTVVGGSGLSQLSVTAASSLSPGTYPLTITGTGGSLVHSTSVTLVVNTPPDFSISASPATASTLPGGTVTYTVSVTPANGFSGDVTLSLTGLSSQGSWTFTPSTVVGGSGLSQLSVTAASSLSPGSYPLTITGTSGNLVRSTSVALVVTAPDFALSISPASRTLRHGGSTTFTITVSSQGGFSGKVIFSVSGLPAGTSAAFKPPSVTAAGTSTMTVKAAGSAARGTFTLTVKGTSGAIVHQATATLTVT